MSQRDEKVIKQPKRLSEWVSVALALIAIALVVTVSDFVLFGNLERAASTFILLTSTLISLAAMVILAIFGAVAIHEAGHYVIARLEGQQLFEIRVSGLIIRKKFYGGFSYQFDFNEFGSGRCWT